jgi:hypothetical protein
MLQPATMLARVMAEPASKVARVLNQIAEQKKAAA